jgi:hypothetical protein
VQIRHARSSKPFPVNEGEGKKTIRSFRKFSAAESLPVTRAAAHPPPQREGARLNVKFPKGKEVRARSLPREARDRRTNNSILHPSRTGWVVQCGVREKIKGSEGQGVGCLEGVRVWTARAVDFERGVPLIQANHARRDTDAGGWP